MSESVGECHRRESGNGMQIAFMFVSGQLSRDFALIHQSSRKKKKVVTSLSISRQNHSDGDRVALVSPVHRLRLSKNIYEISSSSYYYCYSS